MMSMDSSFRYHNDYEDIPRGFVGMWRQTKVRCTCNNRLCREENGVVYLAQRFIQYHRCILRNERIIFVKNIFYCTTYKRRNETECRRIDTRNNSS